MDRLTSSLRDHFYMALIVLMSLIVLPIIFSLWLFLGMPQEERHFSHPHQWPDESDGRWGEQDV